MRTGATLDRPPAPVLKRFPKQRPDLPDAIQRIYRDYYLRNRNGQLPASRLAQFTEGWMHRQVASGASDDSSSLPPRSTLEIGAGTLNQLPYEPADCGPYDVIEPMQFLLHDSPHRARVRHVYSDISEVPPSACYDRVTAVACFEHVLDLPAVVARAGLILRQEGECRVAIPSEGGLLWALGWRLTTGLEFRLRYGLDYGHLMRYEHVNTAHEIADVLGYFFRSVQRRYFGVAHHLSLYQALTCREPDKQRCAAYIDSLATGQPR